MIFCGLFFCTILCIKAVRCFFRLVYAPEFSMTLKAKNQSDMKLYEIGFGFQILLK